MRKRRIDAKTRVICRDCIAGVRGAGETCELLSPRLYWDEVLVSEEDRNFVNKIANRASMLPTGQRLNDWHPDFVLEKLKAVAALEADASADVKAICGRILQVYELRRMEKLNEAH